MGNIPYTIASELEKFLRDNKVYHLFCRNILIVDKTDIIDRISKGFFWNDTPEGHDFWYKLAEKRGDFTSWD